MGATTVREANKGIILEAFEAINEGRLEVLEGHPGFWETRQVIPPSRERFADWRTVFWQQIAEGDRVFSYGALQLTQIGAFGGVAPTGRRATLAGFSLDQVVAGTVVEHNSTTSWAEVISQLGSPAFAAWPARADRPLGSGGTAAGPVDGDKAIVAGLLATLADGDAGVTAGHPGVEDLRAEFAALRGAFPDLALTIVAQVMEGDLVGTRATLRGTHRGTLRGFGPTGRAIVWDHYSLVRVADGVFVEARASADWTAALIQLGLFPAFR